MTVNDVNPGMDVNDVEKLSTAPILADVEIQHTPHPTTGHGHAVNFDGKTVTPEKRTRQERSVEARTISPLEVFPDGDAVVATRESAARDYNGYQRYVAGTSGAAVPGDPVLLIGQDQSRQSLTINVTGAPILIGKLSELQVGGGYLININQPFKTSFQGELYVAAAPGASAVPGQVIYLWAEFN